MTRNELLDAAETYLEYSRACRDKAAESSVLFRESGLKTYHEIHNTYSEQANTWSALAREAIQLAKSTPL